MLWPPPRTATAGPRCARSSTARITSATPAQRAISAGLAVDARRSRSCAPPRTRRRRAYELAAQCLRELGDRTPSACVRDAHVVVVMRRRYGRGLNNALISLSRRPRAADERTPRPSPSSSKLDSASERAVRARLVADRDRGLGQLRRRPAATAAMVAWSGPAPRARATRRRAADRRRRARSPRGSAASAADARRRRRAVEDLHRLRRSVRRPDSSPAYSASSPCRRGRRDLAPVAGRPRSASASAKYARPGRTRGRAREVAERIERDAGALVVVDVAEQLQRLLERLAGGRVLASERQASPSCRARSRCPRCADRPQKHERVLEERPRRAAGPGGHDRRDVQAQNGGARSDPSSSASDSSNSARACGVLAAACRSTPCACVIARRPAPRRRSRAPLGERPAPPRRSRTRPSRAMPAARGPRRRPGDRRSRARCRAPRPERDDPLEARRCAAARRSRRRRTARASAPVSARTPAASASSSQPRPRRSSRAPSRTTRARRRAGARPAGRGADAEASAARRSSCSASSAVGRPVCGTAGSRRGRPPRRAQVPARCAASSAPRSPAAGEPLARRTGGRLEQPVAVAAGAGSTWTSDLSTSRAEQRRRRRRRRRLGGLDGRSRRRRRRAGGTAPARRRSAGRSSSRASRAASAGG